MKNKSKTLILNPVENFPLISPQEETRQYEGLYITDKDRDENLKKDAKILFAGRDEHINDMHRIYKKWAELLNAEDITMRLLSGLHAHIVMFMGIGSIGDKVLLLPVEAGGHFATKAILQRLGYKVIDMAVDYKNFRINHEATKLIIEQEKPNFIFVDRSEGINYEDFSGIISHAKSCSIFDASQYLTNILSNDFNSPFNMGFDMIISTLHKNFPGPQKALLCAKDKNNVFWKRIMAGISNYVSSMHAENVYRSGIVLEKTPILREYSKLSLKNSVELEKNLHNNGVSVVLKNEHLLPTHHIWITFDNKDDAYSAYKDLEKYNILVNYRILPYNLGYGLRLGTTAATLQGLTVAKTKQLACIISDIVNKKNPDANNIQHFIDELIPMNY